MVAILSQSTNRHVSHHFLIPLILNFTAIATKNGEFLIRHYSGKCVSIRLEYQLHLTTACNTPFTLTEDKALKHVESGKCVTPNTNEDDAVLRLRNTCAYQNARYEHTLYTSIKHIMTGKCFHPYLGSPTPSEGTPVVIYSGCNETRLHFNFEGEFHVGAVVRHFCRINVASRESSHQLISSRKS